MNKPKLIVQVWDVIGSKHYSLRTEKAYVHWIKALYLLSSQTPYSYRWVNVKSVNSSSKRRGFHQNFLNIKRQL